MPGADGRACCVTVDMRVREKVRTRWNVCTLKLLSSLAAGTKFRRTGTHDVELYMCLLQRCARQTKREKLYYVLFTSTQEKQIVTVFPDYKIMVTLL